MRIMKRGKKAQFYIIAAIIIIAIVASLASLSNYARTKKEPPEFFRLSDIVKEEGWQVMENQIYENMNYKNLDVEASIKLFLDLFASYVEKNTQEDISLIFLYGDAESNQISGEVYSRQSSGDVNIFIGTSKVKIEVSRRLLADESTNLKYSEANETIIDGEITKVTQARGDKFDIFLTLNYNYVNFTFENKEINKTLTSSPNAYRLLFENLGSGSGNSTQVNLKII